MLHLLAKKAPFQRGTPKGIPETKAASDMITPEQRRFSERIEKALADFARPDGNGYMSPLEIKIMLHYYTIPTDIENVDSDAQGRAIDRLLKAELLTVHHEAPPRWRITPRGKAYVEALCRVPWPIQKWVMPE